MAVISTSKYIKKEELSQTEPLVLTIKECSPKQNVGTPDKPDFKHVLYFEEVEMGCTLNKTRIEQLVEIFGSNDDTAWIGKQIGLVHDPKVAFGGKKVGGVAIVAAV